MRHSSSDNSSTLWATQIWSSKAGFNPVSNVLTHDTPDGKPDFKVEWQWKVIDGIYVPSNIKEAFYHEAGNSVSFERESRLEECVLNQPLDPHQFDYRGLGMRDGDIVLNDLEGAVYKIQGGEPVKLGNYGDRYEPHKKTWVSPKSVLGIGNGVLLIILVGMLRKRLRARRRPAETPS